MPPLINDFSNRLQKNLRHRRKWARRRNISCYRIYDRDLPEFPLAIDCYEDRLHVQIFEHAAAQGDADPKPSQQAEITRVLQQVCNLPGSRISFRTRRPQKGKAQYQKTGATEESFVVHEGGLCFLVDLSRYLDTGLFLDHRQTRALVRQKAADARFLNLFAYTGSFTVYAAAGGAAESVSVDLSRTYQQWSLKNLQLNGLDDRRHRLLQSDVTSYLQRAAAERKGYDLILLDPPSFSNSKRMRDTFDVQRDHAGLIRACLQLLAPDGELLFSNNRRRFRLDPALHDEANIREISGQTVPDDFKRHPPHRCWTLSRR